MRFFSSRALVAALSLAVPACAVTADDGDATGRHEQALTSDFRRLHLWWFGGFEGLGINLDVQPSVASASGNSTVVFLTNGNTLVTKRWNGSTWGAAVNSVSGVSSDPVAVGWSTNRYDVVARASTGGVLHAWDDGRGSFQVENLGGAFDGRPTLSISPDGTRGDVFVRVGNVVWHRGWALAPNTWNDWESLPVTVDSDPVAISTGRGHIELFHRANDGSVRRWVWDGNAKGTMFWQRLGGEPWFSQAAMGPWAKGLPAVAQVGSSIEVYVQGGDDQIYRGVVPIGSGTGTWGGLGSCTAGAPSVVGRGAGAAVDLVVRSKDTNELMHAVEAVMPPMFDGDSVCCGHRGQQGCHWSYPCEAWSTPNSTNTCVECGQPGQLCCSAVWISYCDAGTSHPGLACQSDRHCNYPPCGTKGLIACDVGGKPTCNDGTHPNVYGGKTWCDDGCGHPHEPACRTQYRASDGTYRSRYECFMYASLNASSSGPGDCLCAADGSSDGDFSDDSGLCIGRHQHGDIPDPPDVCDSNCGPPPVIVTEGY